MKCPECGAILHDSSRFCSSCGAKIAPEPVSDTLVQKQPPADTMPAHTQKLQAPVDAQRAQHFESAYATLKQPEAPKPITTPQRWLLLAVILLGFIMQAGLSYAFAETPTAFAGWYATFWLAYLSIFHIFCFQKATERPLGFVLSGAAAFLSIMLYFQSTGYSDQSLYFLNLLAVPCLLMLHAQYVMKPLPRERESGYAILFLTGFFIQPFEHLGRFFASVGSLFKAGEKGRHVWLGILVAVPVLIVVLSLLLSADAVMNALAIQAFGAIDFSDIIWRLFVISICAMLFYSFLYGAAWGKQMELTSQKSKVFGITAPSIVLGTLLAAYAIFTAVQFLYLFGGYGLPDGLTYSEYAVEGFNQLMWVAAINFSVLAFCICRVEQKTALRTLMLLLLIATGVILASAFTRLSLYIGAYGLTFKRIQAFWFLCYLSCVLVLYGIRLYNKKLPLLRLCVLIFVLWYAALNIPNLAAWYPAGA